jgi:hypothetical protein
LRHAPFDNFFALIAMTQAGASNGKYDPRTPAMISGAARRFPEALSEMRAGGREGYWKINSILRPAVQVPFTAYEGHFAVRYSIARLVAALYYDGTRRPLPVGQFIHAHWFSNARPLGDEQLLSLLGALPHYRTLEQGRFDCSDQFEARFRHSSEERVGGYAFHFHRSFVGVGFALPEILSDPNVEQEGWFVVTEDGIAPFNEPWPQHVKISTRGYGKNQ